MTFTAPKIIAGIITAIWGFALAISPYNAQSEPPATTIAVQDYLIEPTTTTSSTLFIDPYASACDQFAALAVNLGWPIQALPRITKVITRESSCIPNSFNGKDPNGGSYGLMQINGFWCQGDNAFLKQRGIVTDCADLLHAETNLLAGLAIWQHSRWNAWGF